MTPRVLMVVGAYFPEMAGGSLQCRTLVHALRGQADVAVLTTTGRADLPPDDTVEGIPVHRVFVNPAAITTKVQAALRLVRHGRRLLRDIDIVHFHGVTEKILPLLAMARLAGRKTIGKLTSVGFDDPVALGTRRLGGAMVSSVRRLDRIVAVSPAMQARCRQAGIPDAAIALIPNGVDTRRFLPASPDERATLRSSLGLPRDATLTTFVGFWSLEKGPHRLFDAWRAAGGRDTALLFIGRRDASHPEVDRAMVSRVQSRIDAEGLGDRVTFVDHTTDVAPYLRASDVFVLPSQREGLPNALLEAMSCGLACVTADIPGVTDFVINTGVDGLVVPQDDGAALSEAVRRLTEAPGLRTRLGASARVTIESRFSIGAVADAYGALYRSLLEPAAC